MPADLEKLRENVGRIRPKVWAEVLMHLGLREFVEVIGDLPFCVAPREIGVRLGKAELSQTIHEIGSCECFGKKEHIGMLGPNFANYPFPKGERLGVRIVDAENPHALFDPVKE